MSKTTKNTNISNNDLPQTTTAYANSSNDGLDSLSEYIKQETTERQGRSIPPLEKWNPEHCGDMNLIIKANGEWWHQGSKINRQSLVDLFASVLWMEEENNIPQYYLKTPVEKIRITVEDVPFLIIDVNIVVNSEQKVIKFTTSTGDVIPLNDEHPLQMRQYKGEERPYIPVRFGMLGLLSRQVFMHLIKLGELSEKEGLTVLSLNSSGKIYELSVPS